MKAKYPVMNHILLGILIIFLYFLFVSFLFQRYLKFSRKMRNYRYLFTTVFVSFLFRFCFATPKHALFIGCQTSLYGRKKGDINVSFLHILYTFEPTTCKLLNHILRHCAIQDDVYFTDLVSDGFTFIF